MIYVSKTQLSQVEYLIGQSIHGNHVLFDNETVRRVFSGEDHRTPISEEEGYQVEHIIEKLILLPTFLQKRAYLEQLDEETYERVVRTYFNIVENNLYEQIEERH